MASSSQNHFDGLDDDNFDETFDQYFDQQFNQYYDQKFDQTFENLTINYDGCSRNLSPLQKCTGAIRVLTYGNVADAIDEYLRLGETITRSCVEHFVESIIYLFGEEYLRRPTPADFQRLLDIGEHRRFPGMIGSIDCMHWEWQNCPTAWKGTLNDINVLDRSPVFDDIIKGQAPNVTFYVNGREYHMAYYLTDEFQQGEDTGSSHVDLTFSTDIPTNIGNMIGVRTRIRDQHMHQQLKADLV
uniref:Uncharacterized protein n=1 Tax=Brassica oleracea var. oleracea TaxID=109376 RepID=A0A0D3CBC7_BRAOL